MKATTIIKLVAVLLRIANYLLDQKQYRDGYRDGQEDLQNEMLKEEAERLKRALEAGNSVVSSAGSDWLPDAGKLAADPNNRD